MRHVRGGCTYKTCCAVATFTLRRDAGLPLTLTADGCEAAAVEAAGARSWADVGEAIEAQAAAAAAAEVEAEEEESEVEGRGAVETVTEQAVRVVRRVEVGLQLQHPFALASGCGFPPWTNYVAGFSGCLDYVWYDPSIRRSIEGNSIRSTGMHLLRAFGSQRGREGLKWPAFPPT